MNQENTKEFRLPENWEKITIGDAADYINGRAFKPIEWEKNGKPIIRIQNLNNSEAPYNYTSKDHNERFKVFNGDLLFAWSASLGAHIWKSGDAWLNQHIFKIITKSYIDKLFLYYYLNQIVSELYSKTHGSGMVHITKKKFEATEINLPPLPEQHRIVDKIEELFSELDNGVANLKKALAQLKVYRQAVLKAAFEGKLTEQWRREQSDVKRRTSNVGRRTSAAELLEQIQAERQRQYEQQLAEWKQAVAVWEAGSKQGKKPSKPARPKAYPPLTAAELEGLPGLPEGWMWVRINDVCTCLDSMRVPINKKERQKRSGKIPYYGANGQVGWIDDYLFDEDLILVVEDETFIGREKPFSYKISGKSWVNNHAHVLRSNSQVNVDYLNYSLAYYPFTPLTTGTTGRKKLTQIALMNAPFKLCSEAEQHQIVQAIESRLSVCDHLEQEIERALLQSEALRQSILKKAFEGRLVPQDPGDEPAGELLRRIKLYQAK